MPVTKFRSIEEASKALLDDPERTSAPGLRRFFNFTMMLRRITPQKPFPRGVTKFRSIEEKTEKKSCPSKRNSDINV